MGEVIGHSVAQEALRKIDVQTDLPYILPNSRCIRYHSWMICAVPETEPKRVEWATRSA